MIYKLTFDDGRIDWCTAKNELHLLKEYDKEYDLSLQEIEDLQEIKDEEAKTIMVTNTEYDETDPEDVETISVYDLAVGDDFCIIASTEFD
uniref:Uncharacterized protein n=1 Tax=viral metagenome TaxID=1070528 RepID=A0A6M3J6C1_9ZZZZ